MLYLCYADAKELHEPKGFCLDGSEETSSKNSLGTIKGEVETRDAGIGRGELLVIWRSDGHTWSWLIGINAGWEDRTTTPEVKQVLSLSLRHSFKHSPKPALESRQCIHLLVCTRRELKGP